MNDGTTLLWHVRLGQKRTLVRVGIMSALGHKRTLAHVRIMSALPPKADIAQGDENVRFVPKADIPAFIRVPRPR
jgi:hypothetical protein